MSNANDLLENLTDEEMGLYSTLSEIEPHVVVNDDRTITVPDELKNIAVQHDHNIETVTFDCPRYWDGHDMSQMAIYVNYRTPSGVLGCYPVDNVTIDENDDSIMHFTWTISRNVTQTMGDLAFLICVKKTDDDGNETNHWNSVLNKDMKILEGIDCGPDILDDYPDVVTQLLTQMNAKADKATTLAGYGIEDAYDKEEVDTFLDTVSYQMDNILAPKELVYTKDEANTLLADKADKATTLSGYGITDAYTKTEVDEAIAQGGGGGGDLSNYYNKSEIYAPLYSDNDAFIRETFANENIFDEDKNSVASDTHHKIGTVFLSGAEASVIISTKENKYAYITDIILYDASGVEIADVEIVNKSGNTRSGKKITVPSNARKLVFTYRLYSSSLSTLCSDMMVTVGDTLPTAYVKGKQLNILSDSPYITESDIKNQNVYYISTSGSDQNDGLSKETPFATIDKALSLGGREIAIEVGEYFITNAIRLLNLNDIRIYAYRNDEVYSYSSPIRDKVKITGAEYYTGYTLNSDGVYQQSGVSAGYDFTTVFKNGKRAIITTNPSTGHVTYHANVMVMHNDKSKDCYLMPVLTYEDCISTDDTFYWDGSTLFFNTLSTDFVKIAVISSEEVIAIYNCNNITITDVEFSSCKLNTVSVKNSEGIIFENCSANASATGMGFSIKNANATLNNCYATKNAYDGFNFHEYGTTIMNDCISENNYDDGCSHHDGCIGTINGGIFSGNGKAGIAPAYGADVNIYNAVCNNNKYGIAYLTTTNGHKNMRGVVSACMMKNNQTQNLFIGELASVTVIACEYEASE